MALGKGIIRVLTLPLLLLNLIIAVIILGIAAAVLDRALSQSYIPGNGTTQFQIIFALLVGVTCGAAYLTGLEHQLQLKSETGVAARSSAWLGLLTLIVSFYLTCKEIHLKGDRVAKLKVIESFVIILTVFHLVYILLLHLSVTTETSASTKPANPNAPAVSDSV